MNAANALTTEDVTCFVGSIYGGTDGGTGGIYGNRHANTYSNSVGNTNQENIVSFRSPHNFNGVSNRAVVSVLRLVFTASAAADIKIIKNATLEGSSSWTSSPNVLLESSDGNVDVTGGTTLYAERAEKQDRFVIDPEESLNEVVKLYPGDVISIVGTADSGSSTINVAANWIEPV